MVQTSTIVAASVGTIATAFVAYAVWFDHRRRTDPSFRKQLKKESKRQARAAREEAEAEANRQRAGLKALVEEAIAEGFPSDLADKESYFMVEVRKAEELGQEGSDVEAALSYYKALKVYPQPSDLIGIYDKTVPQPVLQILAEMIALDPSLHVEPFGGSDAGLPHGKRILKTPASS